MENVSNMLISKIVVTEDSNLTNAIKFMNLKKFTLEPNIQNGMLKMLYYLRDFFLRYRRDFPILTHNFNCKVL